MRVEKQRQVLAQDHQEEGGVGQEEALGGVGGVDVDHHDGGGEDGQEELGPEDEGQSMDHASMGGGANGCC